MAAMHGRRVGLDVVVILLGLRGPLGASVA
jgi:hypothetical protein